MGYSRQQGAPQGAPAQPISDDDRFAVTALGERIVNESITLGDTFAFLTAMVAFAFLLRELRDWGLERGE